MNNEKKFIKLTPFKMQILQSFPFIDADFDAITNYELLCKVVEYLNTTVDNVNLLETDFKTLYNYVHDYFDDLDIQEEINKKLDEMAESGELTNLIKNYVDPFINEQNDVIENQTNSINNFKSNQTAEFNTFKTQVNDQIDEIDTKVNQATSGSPLVANSVSGMTDTDRVYVNTTDGYWYYYNGTNWVQGGIYQSTSDYQTIQDILDTLDEIRTKIVSAQLFNYKEIVKNKNLANTYNVSTPTDLMDADGIDVGNIIEFETPLTTSVTFSTNIEGFSKILAYKENLKRESSYNNSNVSYDSENNNRQITIVATTNAPIKYIRFSYASISNPNVQDLYFCKRSEYTSDLGREYKNYYELNDKLKESHLILDNPIEYNGNEVNTFFKGIAIGDSLTEGTFNVSGGGFVNHKQYAYPMYFYKKTGTTLRNFGVGGATAESWYTRYENVQFPVYDFCIIALGVNDMIQNVPNTTTITYINNIVNKLKSANSDVKCFISTINKAYKNTTGYDNLNTAIRNYVATTSNCYLLDIATYGITDVNTPYVNGHLTALGYRQLANEYANLISYIMYNNPSDFTNIQFSGTEYTNLPTD